MAAEPAEHAEQYRIRNQASFYRAALLLGLIRGDIVVAWADAELARETNSPAALVEISTTDPNDITELRHGLLRLCDEKSSHAAVDAVLAHLHADLVSDRRSYKDTTMVLRQMRSFLKLPAAVDDQIKALMVASYEAKPGEGSIVEARVREWLASHSRGTLSWAWS